MEVQMKSKSNKNLQGALLTALLIGLMLCTTFSLAAAETKSKKVTELKSKDSLTLSIAVKDLSDTAQYFSYKGKDGKKTQFFALLDNLKVPHIAFDACEVCYAAKKGYRQDGVWSVCNNCGQKYPIKSIGVENKTGGCWPAYLPVEIVKDQIVINVSTLTEKQYLFP